MKNKSSYEKISEVRNTLIEVISFIKYEIPISDVLEKDDGYCIKMENFQIYLENDKFHINRIESYHYDGPPERAFEYPNEILGYRIASYSDKFELINQLLFAKFKWDLDLAWQLRPIYKELK